jgi:hypothetical protein
MTTYAERRELEPVLLCASADLLRMMRSGKYEKLDDIRTAYIAERQDLPVEQVDMAIAHLGAILVKNNYGNIQNLRDRRVKPDMDAAPST